MKKIKIVYWVSTGLISLFMVAASMMYLLKNDEVSKEFVHLGYPTYLIYPLAALKILGVIAIVSRKSKILKEFAYAGFFYDFVLAFFAHVMVKDTELAPALIAIILILTSYVTEKKAFVED